MPEPRPYRRTVFDRHGPDVAIVIRAAAYGAAIACTMFVLFLREAYQIGLTTVGVRVVWSAACAMICGGAVTGTALFLSRGAEAGWKTMMAHGSNTPYVDSSSRQDALIMQGKVPEALALFERAMAAAPDRIDLRLRAAEAYAREAHDPVRAAELFRAAQRAPGVSMGDDIYATNRLVDLLAGPLAQRGQALAELRRLIDRYPASQGAANARAALAAMKAMADDPLRTA
ncbi:MAG TPA: hypothetical protein VMH39_15140 [Gemmatimonadaceae bacterium]|nr:hypothetical protein [Gemmatimonadaceae bacterium]